MGAVMIKKCDICGKVEGAIPRLCPPEETGPVLEERWYAVGDAAGVDEATVCCLGCLEEWVEEQIEACRVEDGAGLEGTGSFGQYPKL